MTNLKTKTIELPTWEQLTAKEQPIVIDNYRDINTDHDWWTFTYEDAKSVGISIEGFDLERKTIKCIGYEGIAEISAKIIKDHGKDSRTYKTAKGFLKEYKEKSSYSLDFYSEWFEKFCDAYLTMLQAEYDHLTSDDAIKETLKANEYTFNRETLKIDS